MYFQHECYNRQGGYIAYNSQRENQSFQYGFCEEGRDDNYAYWSYTTKMHNEKYKILLSELERIKFNSWNKAVIKNEFFEKVIAPEDRSRPGDPFLCNVTPSDATYKVTYIPNINAIRIDLHWKIYCEIIFKLVNQKRCAIYDFDTGAFTDIDPVR
jgi:hypothetical protein